MLLLGGFLAVIFVIFVQPERLDLSLSKTQCELLNVQWEQKYRSDFSYSKAWKKDGFDCPSVRSGLARALQFLDDLEFQTTEKLDFYQRLKRQAPLLDRDLLFSRAGKTTFEDRRITLNDLVVADNNPVQVAGILIHEMRHLEQGKNTHVPCDREPSRSCDAALLEFPQQGGAYNFNIYFLDLIRRKSNASEFHKKLAQRDMQKIFDTRFNQVPENAAEIYRLEKPVWMSPSQ